MSDKKSNGDYEVGYGKPPKHRQFKRGQSGNPRGRAREANSGQTDVAGVLGEPLTVTTAGTSQKMSPFEIGVRQLVKRALNKNDLKAILEFLRLCETYGIMPPVPPAERSGGVLRVPWNWDEWRPALEKLDPQLWPGERSFPGERGVGPAQEEP
jgi:hypothetical protein